MGHRFRSLAGSFWQQRVLPAVILVAVVLGACTSTKTMQTTNTFEATATGARVLLVEPDVELAFLKTSGITEVRADWTRAGKENVSAEIREVLANRGHELVDHDVDVDDPREVQIVKLHEAVGETILLHRFLGVPLPSKTDAFDWTLGPGVGDMGGANAADYALFLYARGQYASSGRQIMAIGLAVAGVGGVSTGGQAAYSSLVDMTSGDIVWFNIAQTGPGTDMREPDGAAALVRAILKDIPLTEDMEDGE